MIWVSNSSCKQFTSCLYHFCKCDHPADKFIVTLCLQLKGTILTWLPPLLCLLSSSSSSCWHLAWSTHCATSQLWCVHMLFVLPRVQCAHHFPLSSSYSAFRVVCGRPRSYPVGSFLRTSLQGSKVTIKCHYRSLLFSVTVGLLCNFPFICELI